MPNDIKTWIIDNIDNFENFKISKTYNSSTQLIDYAITFTLPRKIIQQNIENAVDEYGQVKLADFIADYLLVHNLKLDETTLTLLKNEINKIEHDMITNEVNYVKEHKLVDEPDSVYFEKLRLRAIETATEKLLSQNYLMIHGLMIKKLSRYGKIKYYETFTYS